MHANRRRRWVGVPSGCQSAFPYDGRMIDDRSASFGALPGAVLRTLGSASVLVGWALVVAAPVSGQTSTGAASRPEPQLVAEEPQGATGARKDPPQPQPGMRGVPTRERFLQHALGTQGDVRVSAALLSLAATLALVAVAWKKAKTRRRSEGLDGADLPEIEGREDLEPTADEPR